MPAFLRNIYKKKPKKRKQRSFFTFRDIYSPKCCHPGDMVSSFSQCRCRGADSGWSSLNCCSDLVLRSWSPACVSPGPPGATGNGHCPGVTIPQPLQEKKPNNIKSSHCTHVYFFQILLQMINSQLALLSCTFFPSFYLQVCTFLTETMFHKNEMHARSLPYLERDGSSAPDILRKLLLLCWHSASSTQWHFTNAVIFITITLYIPIPAKGLKWPQMAQIMLLESKYSVDF